MEPGFYCTIHPAMKPNIDQISGWARHAGQILKKGFGKEHQIGHKGLIDLVTEMDHRSEDYLLGEVSRAYPEHAIFSEEAGHVGGQSKAVWYIDPLDGTINYAHGLPIYCVSIALRQDDDMQLAVIYDPMQDELYTAERGKGAFLNGHPIHVSNTKELIKSLLVTGFPYDIQTTPRNNLDHYAYFAKRTQGVRRLGSAALDLCYVAAGRFDGYWELGIMPWDIAAGLLIVQEAGGTISDLKGGREYFQPPHALVAAAPAIHPLILEGLDQGRI
jgi:myo-inositol-1(or 4)-monophosphatase